MKKILSLLSITLFVMILSVVDVRAAYNYGPNGEVVASAEATVAKQIIDSSNLTDKEGQLVNGSYSFGELSDVAVFENKVYVSDSSNNVVVVLDENLNYITKFPSEDNEYQLSKPEGLYITKDYIYVCDYSNQRVLLFDHSYNVKQVVTAPDDPAFENYEFRPQKITVNRTGRMYVIAEGINEGILDLNADGTFSRYFGMNNATVSIWEAFWLMFTSEEQRLSQGSNFGASLTNLAIDDSEYVYTVSSVAAGANVIKRLNFKGSDILVRNGYTDLIGDAEIVDDSTAVPNGSSNFIDIDVNDYGSYIALDKTRGRVFTYDFEGNLLYIFGGLSTAINGETNYQSSLFQMPEALCYFGDKILVVDSKNKNLIEFQFTTFGSLVNEATELYYNNDFEKAAEKWEEVLSINTNYYIAYSGIGKAQFREGLYEQAMENLKLGHDSYNYSRAYQQYRYEKISKVFPYIIGIALAGCVFMFIKSFKSNAKYQQREEEGLE